MEHLILDKKKKEKKSIIKKREKYLKHKIDSWKIKSILKSHNMPQCCI